MEQNNFYYQYSTSIGDLTITCNSSAVTSIGFGTPTSLKGENAKTTLSDKTFNEICEYLKGIRKEFDIPLNAQGTDFQHKVWNQLKQIPYGETKSYSEIAQAIGNPKAVRAVGMANNKNPLAIIVPCHRVIGKNGKLVGYAGGLSIKKQLIDLEIKNK